MCDSETASINSADAYYQCDTVAINAKFVAMAHTVIQDDTQRLNFDAKYQLIR